MHQDYNIKKRQNHFAENITFDFVLVSYPVLLELSLKAIANLYQDMLGVRQSARHVEGGCQWDEEGLVYAQED